MSKDNLTPENLEKVKLMLNPTDGSKPSTKKDCCRVLGIAYNVSRLGKLLEAHTERVEYSAARRKANRGKPVTDIEKLFILQAYIDGDSLDEISRTIYRGTTFIKTVLDKGNVTLRPPSHNYFKPEMIPDDACRDRFAIGEIVFSAKYNTYARVVLEQLDKVHGYVYRIWLKGDHQQFAYTPAYEMASLSHLREQGVDI